MPALIEKIEGDYGLRIPDALRSTDYLSRMEVDRWAVTTVPSESGDVRLWFRLEDVDVVEFWITRR